MKSRIMNGPINLKCALFCASLFALAAAPAQAADFFWSSGDFITGTTAPEPLLAGDTLFVQAGGAKRFVGSTFTNQGLVRWQADALQGGNSASVLNSGTWQSESDNNSFLWTFGGRPTFTNTGTFRKTAGVNTNVGSWAFINNGGLIDAQVGSITFNAGYQQFNAGSRFTGAGGVIVNGGGDFNGAFESDSLTLGGGTFNGAGASFTGGVGGGAGTMGWTAGDLAGSWTIGANASVTGSGATAKRQVGSNITNNGRFVYDTTQQLQGGNSSVFTNNAEIEARQSAVFSWIFGGAPTYINNASGTVRATDNATLTFGQGILTSNGGLFTADPGSAIVYTGAQNRFNDGTRFVGDNRVIGTARYVDQIQAGGLTWVNGTQVGGDGTPGSFGRMSGAVEWQGGDVGGAFEIRSGATLRASTGTAKRQIGGLIVNNGTMVWDTTAVHQTGNSSRLENNGRYEFTQDSSITYIFGGQGVVDNAGLIIKTGGAGTSSLATIALTNNGTIDVRSGSIALPTNFANAGTLMGTGAFDLGGTLANNGHIAPGGASTGTLTINGNLQSSGSLLFQFAGLDPGQFDVLDISGAAAFSGGTIGFDFLSFTPAAGNSWGFLHAALLTGWDTNTFVFTGLDPGLSYGFNYANGIQTLTLFNVHAVPDGADGSGSILFLAIGLAGLAVSRRTIRV